MPNKAGVKKLAPLSYLSVLLSIFGTLFILYSMYSSQVLILNLLLSILFKQRVINMMVEQNEATLNHDE